MPIADTMGHATAVQQALLQRADELSSAWAAGILNGCRVGPDSNHLEALPEQASRLVHEILAGIAEDRATETADPAHAHAFAVAAIRAGVALPDVLMSLDSLATLLVDAAADEVGMRLEVPATHAFAIADRIHRGVRTIAAATGAAYRKTASPGSPEDASKRFEGFARTIAHELKNPLGAARGAAELLVTGEGMETPEARARFAELVLRNVNRALELLDDIRLMTRVAAPGGPSKPKWELLPAIADDVLHEVQQHAGELGVKVVISDSLPARRFDAMRLRVALMNLVWNAIKYSDLDKAECWVRVDAHTDDDGRYCIEVSDNGLGIPREVQPQIFQRHFRAHPDHTSGSGLGLALTREAIMEAGGDMEFESEPGVGSTFRILMPEQESRSEEAAAD